MLNTLQRKLGDDVKKHQEITTRHGTWNRVWNQQAHVHVCTGTVGLQYSFSFSENLDYR
jgi:hypothetical protein